METKKLCKSISKRVLDPRTLHDGDFISYLDFEKKEIRNNYFVVSIRESNKFVVKCYDIIRGEIVEFCGNELNRILRPENTDKYLYEFNIPYVYTHFIGDHVKFITPININKNDCGGNKDIFIIKKVITTKNGAILVNLVKYNKWCYPMYNIPLVFLEKIRDNDNMKNEKNNIKIYNLDNKEVLKENNDIIDEAKLKDKFDNGDEKRKKMMN